MWYCRTGRSLLTPIQNLGSASLCLLFCCCRDQLGVRAFTSDRGAEQSCSVSAQWELGSLLQGHRATSKAGPGGRRTLTSQGAPACGLCCLPLRRPQLPDRGRGCQVVAACWGSTKWLGQAPIPRKSLRCYLCAVVAEALSPALGPLTSRPSLQCKLPVKTGAVSGFHRAALSHGAGRCWADAMPVNLPWLITKEICLVQILPFHTLKDCPTSLFAFYCLIHN